MAHAMEIGTGLVIGRFDPPHRGHDLLVQTALSQSRELFVLICERPSDSIPASLRAEWLRELHPAVRVIVLDDRDDERDVAVWAANTMRVLGRAPDAVFSSEAYGEAFARALGCVHVEVDRARTKVPCFARFIREDPYAHWEVLAPPVRAWYAKRVCVLGAESTGTTTLSIALAEHYRTVWVREYGREYSETKTGEWTTPEFLHVGAVQTARENLAARDANRVLICDTNAFATTLWHRRYVGHDDEAVRAAGDASRCDLYLLTGDEIPFVADGMRDGEHIRNEMHRWFEEALRAQPVPWLLLRGSHEERMRIAIEVIDRLIRA